MKVGDLVRFKKSHRLDDTDEWRRKMYPYKFEMGIVLTEPKQGELRVMFPSLTCKFTTRALDVINASR
jgi:hypothetical protein